MNQHEQEHSELPEASGGDAQGQQEEELPRLRNGAVDEDYPVIKRILAGNKGDFAILQKKYQRIVSALIRRMVRNSDDVDDLAQETFIKAYNALHSYQPEYQFSRWLYRIASNTCIDFLRKKRLNVISIDAPIPHSDGESQMELADPDPEPADLTILNRERKAILDAALASLPEKYRKIIHLRHDQELDYQEIADMLELPLGTVKAHLFRARKLLYKKLQKHVHHFQS